MRRSVLALIAAAILLSSSALRADDLVYSRFADYLEALRQQVGIPGLSAAIAGPLDILWERGFGYQDQSRALPMRSDTPVHLDGLTQIFTANFILQCADNGRLSLDDPIGAYVGGTPEPAATFRQLLSHTSMVGDSLAYSYRPDRLDALAGVIQRCEGASFRSASAQLFERLAMVDSVPGPDVLTALGPVDPSQPSTELAYYSAILARLATPYAVDSQRRPSLTQYTATTLTPSTGMIASVHDVAEFDVALRTGFLVAPDTLAQAWQPMLDGAGKPLPHGLGWFVQGYNGELVVWQFGAGTNGSSSLVVSLPRRGITLVLLANSTGLVKSFPLTKGDVTTSPFARIFLSLFTR